MWYFWVSMFSLNFIHCFLRITSAYSIDGEKGDELQLKLVNLMVNHQHVSDSLQHRCSNCFSSRSFLLENMRGLMKCIETEWSWSEQLKWMLFSSFPFLFIVLYIGLIRELGRVLSFLSSLSVGLSEGNVMKQCVVLEMDDLSVYLTELCFKVHFLMLLAPLPFFLYSVTLLQQSCPSVLMFIYLKLLFHYSSLSSLWLNANERTVPLLLMKRESNLILL